MIGTSPTHVPLTAESAAKQLVADTTSETPQQTVSQITECHFATLDLACFFAYATLPSPPPTQVTLRYIVSPHLNALFTFTTTSHVHAVPNTRKVPIQTALEVVRAMARSRQLHIDTNGARFASTLFVVKLDRGEDGTLAIPLAASTYTCYDTLTAFDAEEYAIVLFPEFCGGPARNPYKMPAKACQTAESSTSATTPPPPPPAPKTTASSTASTGTTPPLPLTKADLAKQFQQRMDDKIVPPEVLDTFNEELEKLNSTDNYESNKARAYLKYITRLPWTPKKPTGRELNPPKLKDIANHLNSGHYGIDDAKSRILEFMAMSKLSNQPQGKVLCLAGSPGVGKTSLAASIASALNRSFARIALPSISTAADLVGHSRAWSSARPGCIATILAQLGEADPVILLDEVDKLSTGTQNGDVNGTLLAMLDPEQNHEFMDLYVGAPIDLSRVLFVATANA
ncbi:P-loop containing nucleoside triphosphate hydrolase protein, partial [Chytriomyces sp. MP71]